MIFYCEVRDSIGEQVVRIQETAKAIAHLDVLASLACVAQSNDYVRPSINTKGVIDIQGGRHPVVEKMNNNQMFIDNDTYLDNKNHRISIITGPNMAGKVYIYAPVGTDRAHGPRSAACTGKNLPISALWIEFSPVSVHQMIWPVDRVLLWWR